MWSCVKEKQVLLAPSLVPGTPPVLQVSSVAHMAILPSFLMDLKVTVTVFTSVRDKLCQLRLWSVFFKVPFHTWGQGFADCSIYITWLNTGFQGLWICWSHLCLYISSSRQCLSEGMWLSSNKTIGILGVDLSTNCWTAGDDLWALSNLCGQHEVLVVLKSASCTWGQAIIHIAVNFISQHFLKLEYKPRPFYTFISMSSPHCLV